MAHLTTIEHHCTRCRKLDIIELKPYVPKGYRFVLQRIPTGKTKKPE